MSSKFIDTTAIMQVIGCIYKHPYLLEQEDKYFFHEEDFTERFHQTLFGSIYNLKMLGANKIDIDDILNYASMGLTEEKRKIMYEGLNLINDRLNQLCDEYDSNEN